MATSIIKGCEVEAKEGVTVFRQGKLRIVRLDTPSNWCSTLETEDRPSVNMDAIGSIYNGSTYVTCRVSIGSDGKVQIIDNYGNYISGAQWGYLNPKYVTYFVD